MRCKRCKRGQATAEYITLPIEKKWLTMIVKRVPALVCDTCGEQFIEDWILAQLYATAEHQAQAGVLIDVREFLAPTESPAATLVPKLPKRNSSKRTRH